jgi:hypothetical protein
MKSPLSSGRIARGLFLGYAFLGTSIAPMRAGIYFTVCVPRWAHLSCSLPVLVVRSRSRVLPPWPMAWRSIVPRANVAHAAVADIETFRELNGSRSDDDTTARRYEKLSGLGSSMSSSACRPIRWPKNSGSGGASLGIGARAA